MTGCARPSIGEAETRVESLDRRSCQTSTTPSLTGQVTTERARRTFTVAPQAKKNWDPSEWGPSAGMGEAAQPLAEPKVLAVVDRHVDERRAIVFEGAHQGRVEVGGGRRPEGPWGSETQIRSRGEYASVSVVLVDQAAEKVTSANIPRTHSHRDLVLRQGCRERERAMGAAAVVVFGICPERPIEMPPTQDQRVGVRNPDSITRRVGSR